MALSRFQNNLRFAFHKEKAQIRESIPFNRIEKIGNLLSWFVYEFKDHCIKTVCDPRFLTVIFTGLAMLIAAFLFYPSNSWHFLSTACSWIFNHIHWGYMRFGLWLISEATILGVGMRAFGRFTNQKLLEHYQSQANIKKVYE